MKRFWFGLWLVCGPAMAQTVFINGIDVNGQAVRGVGLVNLTNTTLPVGTMVPSIAQLSGVTVNNHLITDNYLLPLRVLDLATDDLYPRTSNGLCFYDERTNPVLLIRSGTLWGAGGAISNLTISANAISGGKLSVAVLPTGTASVWNAGGMTVRNLAVDFTGTPVAGLNASQITAGRLPVSVLPNSGIWDAGGLVLTNVEIKGGTGGVPLDLSLNSLLVTNAVTALCVSSSATNAIEVVGAGTAKCDGFYYWNATVINHGGGLGAYTNMNTMQVYLSGNYWGIRDASATYYYFMPTTGQWVCSLGTPAPPTVTFVGGGVMQRCTAVYADANGKVVLPSNFQGGAYSYNVTSSDKSVTNTVTTNGMAITMNLCVRGALLAGLNASQITAGRLSGAVLPSDGVWDAGGLVVNNLVVAGQPLGNTNFLAGAGGTVTNLTVVNQALVATLTATNVTVLGTLRFPAQGDLTMGSFTNQP